MLKKLLILPATAMVISIVYLPYPAVAQCPVGQSCFGERRLDVPDGCTPYSSYCIQEWDELTLGCVSSTCTGYVWIKGKSCVDDRQLCDAEDWGSSYSCCGTSSVDPPDPPCETTSWVDQACGNVTNGCGYETMRQTRTEGCGDAETQCAARVTCPWPGVVQGYKRSEPVGSPNPNSAVTVTVSGWGSTAAQPAVISGTTTAGATRTASVSSVAAGYDVASTLCYNATTCHNAADPANAAVAAGVSRSVADNSIRALGNMSTIHYADLWWHFCQQSINVPPASVTVTGASAAGNVCIGTGTATITWGSTAPVGIAYQVQVVSGATTNYYPAAGITTQTTTSLTIPITVGSAYTVRVRAINACRGYSAWSAPYVFTVVTAPQPPTNVVARELINSAAVTFLDGSTNETQFNIQRQSGFGGNVDLASVASTTTATTGTSYEAIDSSPAYGISVNYCVRGDAGDTYPGGPSGCRTSAYVCNGPLNVRNYADSWFAVQGGGIAAGGTISMYMPPLQPPVAVPVLPTPIWVKRGEPVSGTPLGLPGVVYGGDYAHVQPLTDLAFVSDTKWAADTSLGWGSGGSGAVYKPENKYASIKQRVVTRLTTTEYRLQTVSTDQDWDEGDLVSQIETANDNTDGIRSQAFWVNPPVTILAIEGGANLVLNGDIDVAGRRVLLFVDGNVSITGEITVDAGGFFGLISGGNISVDGTVGDTPPATFPQQYPINEDTYSTLSGSPAHLTGIFYAQGIFSTGDGNQQLRINGTVVGLGVAADGTTIIPDSVVLGRESLGPYPSEFIHFDPYMFRTLREVGLRRVVRQQLLSP